MTLIQQLEREQYEEYPNGEVDALERAWRIGHNALLRCAIAIERLDAPELMEKLLVFVSEQHGDDVARAFNRGRNAGVRHVRDVQREHEQRQRAECEARDKLAREQPIEFCLQELVENTPAEAE